MKKSSFVAILLVAFGLLFTSGIVAQELSSSDSSTHNAPKGHGLEGNSAADVAGEFLPE